MKKKITKVPVTERAVIQRINRKFRSLDGPAARELKKTRGARAEITLGDYYILDTERNFIDEHHVDPEDLGRELEVLSDSEEVCEE